MLRSTVVLGLLAGAAAFAPSFGLRRAATARTAVYGPDDGRPAAERIDAMVKENNVMLFMKGTKLFPQCGFSNTATQILGAIGCDYETYDVLSDESVRNDVKDYSAWPTIPQLYVNGEFTGGCDIMIELYQSGELAETIEIAAAS